MEGTRINSHSEKIQQVKENLLDLTDMDQVQVIHEIIDDTPYKTKNYMKYLHDEYYIQHNKPEAINQSIAQYELDADRSYKPYKDLLSTVSERHSLRDFENKSIDFKTFSNIIYYSFGVKFYGLGAYNQKKYPFKYTNSQGGLNYLDLYIVVNQVDSLEQGLYYYDFMNNTLCLLDRGNMRPILNEINFQNEFSVYSNFVCFLVADMHRVVPKYYKRAYRFAHVDTGIVAAYLQLIAESYHVSSCAVAGFLEHKVEDLLGLNGEEFPTLSICFGCKPEEV